MSFRSSSGESPILSGGVLCLFFLVFVGISFVDLSGAWLLRGRFIDPDDVLHLLRAQAWLDGQSWFDQTFARIAPPKGVVLHFSRLAELPLAGCLALARLIADDPRTALLLAAGICPVLLLVIFWGVLVWAVRPLVASGWSRIVVPVSFLVLTVLPQFSPGRVDHHGIAALFIMLALGCFVRVVYRPAAWFWAASGGVGLALSLQLALETLPWLLVCSMWMGGLLVWRGRIFARSVLVFAFSLLVVAFLLLAATVHFSAYTVLDSATYSGLYVLLCALIAIALAMTSWPVLWRKPILRAIVGAGAATTAGAIFLTVAPSMLAGPYGATDAVWTTHFLPHIIEAKPFGIGIGTLAVFSLVLLDIAALKILFLRQERFRDFWLLHTLLLVLSAVLTVFYQKRVFFYLGVFSILPLSAVASYAAQNLVGMIKERRGRGLSAVFAVSLLFTVFVWAANAGPVQATPRCNDTALWRDLVDSSSSALRSHIIMNTPSVTGRILFETPHSVLASFYHTSVRGNLAASRFFQSRDESEARSILRQTGADWVLVCSQEVAQLFPAEGEETLSRRLSQGHPPVWLRRRGGVAASDLVLYEVVPSPDKAR